MARNYSNTAFDTTLTASIGAGDPTMVVASASGWPAAPFAAVLDPGLTTEEVVQITVKVGTTFTITRGFDGTTAGAHALAAVVRHAAIAGDFTDLQAADTAEASTRASADTALQTNITSEASTRSTADFTLQTNINTNTSAISTHAALTTSAHGGIVASTDSRLTDARTPTTHASTHASAGSDPLTLAESQITNLTTDLAGKQPLDSDLTTIAALTATTDNFIVSVASAWASRTVAQVRTTLGLLALAFKATVATADIDDDAVTYAKIQNVSATSRILGRTTAGAGDVEELTGAQALSIAGAATEVTHGRLKLSGTTYYSLPGVLVAATLTTNTPGNGFLWYFPIYVYKSITADQLACEVTTLAAGGHARLGIYNHDTDMTPGSLIVDGGELDTSTTGVKTASISQTLAPGAYYLGILCDNNTNVFRAVNGLYPNVALNSVIGASALNYYLRGTTTYGALPTPGPALGSPGFSSIAMAYPVFLRISAL